DINSSDYCIVGAEFSILESKENIVGYGRATTFQEAENIAILEAIERFCMFNIENCTHRGILKEVIENPYIRNELKEYEDENIYYIEAHNYKTNDSSNIPLQFVDLVVKDNKRMVLETSNGTAIGTSYHEAMLYALLEFIERDAFLTFWHKKVKLDMIDVASLNVEQKNIIENFENDGKKVYLFDMAIDIDIPTILCLIISNKEKPATYVSSGTHIDPELAVDAALKEAIVAHNIYRTNNAVGKLYNNKFEVEGLSDHFNYYSHPSKITTYDWLIETSEKKNLYEVYPKIEKNFSDVEAVEFVIKKMENIKEIYSVLLENRFIQNKGLYVVKVVIPEMQTMYFGYKNKRININRLDAAINNSKHRYKVEFNRGEYYDEPHPFP
ncbi:YcaO-like family protein, partial [Bacillus sp. NPDC060175]|uniref:YcaO-like family protein n=1 Tax=Bacillus sp. NPDC060175 TaxID=3347061 RepID=UPI00364DBF03